MFTLDDKIEIFTDTRFSAEAAAQHFFATYGEAEVTKKLTEMSGLQGEIEKVLKQKVRQNYGLFMHANEEISRIGMEMQELQGLVDNTRKLIQDVQSNRETEARLEEARMQRKSEQAKVHVKSSESIDTGGGSSAIASWVSSAPEDMTRLIVEQQFQQAVSLALRFKAYIDSLKGMAADLSPHSVLGQLQKRMDDSTMQLAQALQRSIPRLPHSPLWGAEEQEARLTLLIALGHHAMAAEAFSSAQVDVIKRKLRTIEATGDPRGYTAEISRSFYASLAESAEAFLHLFAEHRERPSILSVLTQWIHNQTASYVLVLARQIQLGCNESSALVIIQMKQLAAPGTPSSSPMQSPHSSNQNFSIAATASSSSSSGNAGKAATSQVTVSAGPLSFAADCIDNAYREAECIDELGLVGCAMLGWLLQPEVQKMVKSFAEDLMREAAAMVKQDDWNGISTSKYSIAPPSSSSFSVARGRGDAGAGLEERVIGGSIVWFVHAVSYFLREAWTLVTAELHDYTDETGRAEPAYTRDDLSGVEPLVALSVVRLLVRLACALEAVDVKHFTRAQLAVFQSSVR